MGREAPRESRATLAASTIALGYWLAYAYASGVVRYYPTSVSAYLVGSPNPNLFLDATSVDNLYFASGAVWFPNGHLELAFALGPTAMSVAVAVLLGMNLKLVFLGRGIWLGLRSTGASLIPLLLSGGCCTLPLLPLIVGFATPVALGLSGALYQYTVPVNVASLSLMLYLYLHYKSKTISQA
jgi:hypothetical protein